MIIYYVCNNPDCENNIKKFITDYKKIAPFLDCAECGTGKMERQLSAPTTKSTQIIDNGVNSKQVELVDVVLEKEIERLSNKDD